MLGVVTEAAHRNTRSDRLSLCWNDGVDAATLTSCIDLGISITGISGNRLDANSCRSAHLVDLRLDDFAFVRLTCCHHDVEDNTYSVVNGGVLLIRWF